MDMLRIAYTLSKTLSIMGYTGPNSVVIRESLHFCHVYVTDEQIAKKLHTDKSNFEHVINSGNLIIFRTRLTLRQLHNKLKILLGAKGIESVDLDSNA